ncbi:MAG: HAD hydrolase-like protein [Lachnospiraceae bacterium]
MIAAFDLDGTIINSEEGITNCVRYVLEYFDMEQPRQEELLCFIGPPLRQQFMKIYGFDAQKAEKGVIKFRERFDKIGLYECQLYPGIRELILSLHQKGARIALASSKHEDACIRILEHFDLLKYFEVVAGATRDGKINTKAQVLHALSERMQVSPREITLIGDTAFDVMGAIEAGVHCAAVTYGFGSRDELEKAGAEVICDSVGEVGQYLETI